MKKWIQKMEAMAMAVAFAEAGEWSTAQEIMEKQERKQMPEKRAPRKTPDKRPRMRT